MVEHGSAIDLDKRAGWSIGYHGGGNVLSFKLGDSSNPESIDHRSHLVLTISGGIIKHTIVPIAKNISSLVLILAHRLIGIGDINGLHGLQCFLV